MPRLTRSLAHRAWTALFCTPRVSSSVANQHSAAAALELMRSQAGVSAAPARSCCARRQVACARPRAREASRAGATALTHCVNIKRQGPDKGAHFRILGFFRLGALSHLR